MKYWGLLLAKVAGIAAFAVTSHWLVRYLMPVKRHPLGTDLGGSFVIVFWFLAICGLCWAAVVDQRYRCRACACRLRMPVATGSWGRATLFGRPKMEYICPYGHGTMNVAQLQITGHETPEWDEHGDMWKELESIGSTRD